MFKSTQTSTKNQQKKPKRLFPQNVQFPPLAKNKSNVPLKQKNHFHLLQVLHIIIPHYFNTQTKSRPHGGNSLTRVLLKRSYRMGQNS